MLISKKKGRAILIVGTVLAALAFRVATVTACSGGVGLEAHVEHIAKDLCALGSSVRLIAYAVIGLFVVNVISLLALLVKKAK